jgi:hypothetical protein
MNTFLGIWLFLFFGLSKLFAPTSDGDTCFHPDNIKWYQGLNLFNVIVTFIITCITYVFYK